MIIFTLIFLTACMSVTHYKFNEYKNLDEDIEQRELERVFAECELLGEQAKIENKAGGLIGATKKINSFNKVVDACMRSKGFKRFKD